MDVKKDWPAWRYGPNGRAAMFERSEDVPSDWRDHPSKVGVNVEGKTASVELDTAGWPWMAVLHARSKSKTKDGLWQMKVGVSRPDPKPGYPLDL